MIKIHLISIAILIPVIFAPLVGCSSPAERYVKEGEKAERKKNFKKAISKYEKAIELDPKYMSSYIKISDIYREQKKFDRAEHYLKEAIKIDPDYYKAYRRLSKLYRLQKEYTKARMVCQQTLARPGINNHSSEKRKIKKELVRIEAAEKGVCPLKLK
ncbi:tetratricopeptide repeat protein [Candidatus Sumerlaeota bacterium]|nr:tetratricopeptide repeat protein [Candidatus Sumerlaeota bacterium]